MALFQNSLKRCIPFILALIVFIGVLPVPHVSAAETDYFLEGTWVFNDSISWPSASLGTFQVNFFSNGYSFVSMSVAKVALRYQPSVGSLDQGEVSRFDGLVTTWVSDAWKVIDFGSVPQSVDQSFYEWFTSNAIKQGSFNYFVDIDGSSFTYSTTAETITLDLIITANDYKISVDGSEEVYTISDTVLNNDNQQFAGLSVNGVVDQVDYGIGTHTITLSSSSSTLLLGTVWKYPLYIDPNGGTWDGTSGTSVFWELPNTDTDEIYDPVRSGYTFSGWTFMGDGEFNDAGDPPHSYEHGTAPGYLIANWDGVFTYTHMITIDGSSYIFSAENAAPPVTFNVTSTGCIMSYGDTTKSWTYSGEDTFNGLYDSVNNYTYSVGSSFSVLGSSGGDKVTVFTPVIKEELISYTTTVNLYDNSGSLLLFTHSGSSDGTCPQFKVNVSGTGCVIDDVMTHTWTYQGEGTVAGFSLVPGSDTIFVASGGSFTCGGLVGQNTTLNLYLVLEDSSSGSGGSGDDSFEEISVDFVSWLKTAVGGFLDFEIFPGLSLDEILYFILVVQLLMWFLKVAK